VSKTEVKLPGEDLVKKGLKDLSEGHSSPAALLVLIGAPRLRRLGILISTKNKPPLHPEHALYQTLQIENPKGVHSRYNAFIRRLISYERALEQIHRRA